MVEKKLGYSCSVHSFDARGKNYPLTKAMVNHNHDRVKTIDQRKVSDEVDREVLEGVRALKGKGGDGWDCRMGEDLVCLANCAARNVFPDIGGKASPLVILGKESNGTKMTIMATFEGAVGSSNQIMVGWFGDIETSFVIESSIVKGPILGSQPIKEGSFHLMDGLKDEQVAGGGVLDFVC